MSDLFIWASTLVTKVEDFHRDELKNVENAREDSQCLKMRILSLTQRNNNIMTCLELTKYWGFMRAHA